MTREECIKVLQAMWRYKDCGYSEYEIREALEMAIKALEQTPCDDAVSRQAVLDMATTIQTDDCSGNEVVDVVYVEDIGTLPSVTPAQKWISVSERLPEENKDVLIDIKEGKKHSFYVTRLVDVTYWVHLGRDVNVVAWLPLPEPYKVGSEE